MTCDSNDEGLVPYRMEFMDDKKLKLETGILDPTRAAKRSFTVELNRESEMYKEITAKDFTKAQREMVKKKKMEVVVYIEWAIDNFMKESKRTITIPYHFK